MRATMFAVSLSACLVTTASATRLDDAAPPENNSSAFPQLALQCLFVKEQIIGSMVVCYFNCGVGGQQQIVTETLRFPATCPLFIDV
jgi:hypothetical protein